ncbi:MAG: SRPBCC family protein [Thermomicrobiales bacterium]|nr:SRPBCC family protein [Thermomicrobiales bacterium]
MTNETTANTLTLPSDHEIEMTRIFNAPRALVWAAYTDPRHVPNWWGTGDPSTTTVDEMDVRPGGRWRWLVQQGEDEYGFGGEYVEVAPPEKLVYTFDFEPPSTPMTYTLTFDELDGKTRLTARTRFASKEARDNTLGYGMESGANMAWDQLDALLATLQS